ncbi:TetR/AcrR family transcriptional regulator [Nocardia thailandica]|uniref:TetR/AcrR family transcriptional regulator n=1 Tax=Nocardia thailandica TaxID=257275 RepID=UPI00031D3C71|nr:TetR/AcrR family transcriptional regulator [Nocardia thailandica]
MGTREDLLAAAKQCLADRGYARTTVRDIVAASGTNLAAINYHFGTRDKLLTQAMIESSATAVQQILDTVAADEPGDRLTEFLRRLVDSFTTDRAVWVANAESYPQAIHTPELRAELAAAQARARRGLAELFGHDGDESVGALLQTMIGGLLLQWLIDPEHAPSPERLVTGMRALARPPA